MNWVAWLGLMPLVIAMVVIAILPGYFWVRTQIRSSVVAAAAGPALTVGTVSILSMIWHALGVPYTRATVMPVLALLTCAGAAVYVLRRRANPEHGELLGDSLVARPPLRADAPASHAYRILSRRARGAIWFMVFVGWVLAALPMLIAANPRDPVQQWDSVFHVNGVWSILETSRADPFGGLAPLYGGREVFYPNAWHAFTALFATPETVIQTSNAASLALMALWAIGGTAFTAVVTTSRVAVVVAPVAAGCMLSMPADALTMYNQWPNALGVILLPGIAAMSLVWGRRLARSTDRGLTGAFAHLPLGGLIALGFVGMVLAHPTAAFSLAVLLIPPIIASMFILVRRSAWIGHYGVAAATWVVCVVAVCAPLWMLGMDRVQAMGDYPRRGISYEQAFSTFLTPYPPFTRTIGLILTITITAVLMLIGIIALIRGAFVWSRVVKNDIPTWPWPSVPQPEAAVPSGAAAPSDEAAQTDAALHCQTADSHDAAEQPLAMLQDSTEPPSSTASMTVSERADLWIATRQRVRESYGPRPTTWLIVSFLLFAALTFMAYAPDFPGRTYLLAPWYMDARRIMGVQNLTMIPLIAFGFEQLVNWVRSHRVRAADEHHAQSSLWRVGALLGVWIVAMSLGGAMDARLWAVRYVYDADHLGKPGMSTNAELNMFRRMPQTVPEDALIVGDPIAGEAYSLSIGQRQVVFRQLSTVNKDTVSQDILRRSFNEIHTNPEVCQVVRDLGITHFFEDEDGQYYNFARSSRMPGFYNVDTSHGFELVDTGGTAKLYRITACD